MECYAASTNGVGFFNATTLFLTEEDAQIEEYFNDPVHPLAGWGEAIVQKVLELTGGQWKARASQEITQKGPSLCLKLRSETL
jgi:hypothetical protein